MMTSLVVFKKELVDSLRDRRTLMTMVVIPLFLFPALIGISSKMMIRQATKARKKTLEIAVISNNNAESLSTFLQGQSNVRLVEGLTVDGARSLIQADSLQALIVVDPGFDAAVQAMGQGKVTFYFKSTEDNEIEKGRVTKMLDQYEDQLRQERFKALSLDPAIDKTVTVVEQNLASNKEQMAAVIGGFLPYLFIIFCFTGSMYVAIDLAAGEKERGTLETLLTSPASRLSIILGKFGVVALIGMGSAAVSMVGLYLGIRLNTDIPAEILTTILGILELKSVVLLLSLLFPLTVFFAGVLLSVSIFAKTYKEAQSFVQPLLIAVIVPAFVGLLPGMSLSAGTALIPILNVSLATKGIIAGNAPAALLVEVYVSMIFFALLSIVACVRVFSQESTIFRGA